MLREEPYVVWLVESIPGDLVGLTEHDQRRILVAAWQPVSEIPETLIHEALHAYGGSHPTTSDDQAERVLAEAEEHFIQRAERRAYYSLRKMGLQLPDMPRGFAAMRARSIAARRGQ